VQQAERKLKKQNLQFVHICFAAFEGSRKEFAAYSKNMLPSLALCLPAPSTVPRLKKQTYLRAFAVVE